MLFDSSLRDLHKNIYIFIRPPQFRSGGPKILLVIGAAYFPGEARFCNSSAFGAWRTLMLSYSATHASRLRRAQYIYVESTDWIKWAKTFPLCYLYLRSLCLDNTNGLIIKYVIVETELFKTISWTFRNFSMFPVWSPASALWMYSLLWSPGLCIAQCI